MIHRLSICLVALMLGISGQSYAEVMLSNKYTMNLYKMTCKKWRNNQPMQLVIVTDMIADKHSFFMEPDVEGGGPMSLPLDAMSQAELPDEDINRDVEVLMLRNTKIRYPSADAALISACDDQKNVAKPATSAKKPAEPNDCRLSFAMQTRQESKLHWGSAGLGFPFPMPNAASTRC